MRRQLFLCSLAMACLLAWSAGAQAAVISWNLNDWSDSPTGAASPGTGVVPVGFWNDTWLDGMPAPKPMTGLRDSTGATTGVDVTWDSWATYNISGAGVHLGPDADGSLNKEMLHGYLNAGPAPWGPSITYSEVAFSGIPYASYDIIAYFSSDVGGREGDVTDGTTTYSFNTVGAASVAGANALFLQTTDTASTYLTEANYAVFSGLSGSSQAIRVQMRDDDEWAGIAAIQIVQNVPEPTCLSLACFGAVLLGRRRK